MKRDDRMDHHKETGSGSSGRGTHSRTVIIGAGASGCMAAVSAAYRGDQVLLLDANDRIGRKIYATGNGRCNLTNLYMSAECYRSGGEEDLSAFFTRFDERDMMDFWTSRGIYLHDRQGYVYPRTDQASTIAEGFGKILDELHVNVETGQQAVSIEAVRDRFLIRTKKGDAFRADRVILACGGMAGPQYGCKGDGYRFAAKFGHTVAQPVPALVPLLCSEERILSAADGVRCDAAITLYAGEQKIFRERGELQMTKKGISGIPVFQMSGPAAAGLQKGHEMRVSIDFLPDLTPAAWEAEKQRRLGEERGKMMGTFFLGLVNRKILDMVLRKRNLQAEKKASKVDEAELVRILDMLRDFRLRIDGTGTFAQAQVTAGGVPLSETDENLQSRLQPGLYLAGELLDVDGRCGGYNLQWAMTSGWIAGGGDKERIRI